MHSVVVWDTNEETFILISRQRLSCMVMGIRKPRPGNTKIGKALIKGFTKLPLFISSDLVLRPEMASVVCATVPYAALPTWTMSSGSVVQL